jgi:hypothetical protein
MLTELTPGSEDASDLELLQDLNRTCRQMQQRIVEMIDRVQNEDVTCELLRINDELNNVFLRYDRFERLRGGSQPQPPPAAAQPSPVAAQASEPAVANLIDLATPEPAMAAATNDPFSTNDVQQRLAGINIGGSTVTSQLDNLSRTNANTGQAAPDDDDFDMFAQSRQSFDQNRQQMQSTGTYSSQQSDMHSGGLNTAVSAKNTGNPTFGQDKPNDYDEMEKWLKENPQEMQPAESATSTEFDRFLAERAREVDNLPDLDAVTGNGTNPRRQIRKDDADNALFAL